MRGLVLIGLLILAVAMSIASCSAPRNNPLDPANPSTSVYVVQGSVLTDGKSPRALEDVTVFWNNERISVMTDENGSFILHCSTPIDGWVYFQKAGFTIDSIYISWNGKKDILINERLNAVPVASNLSLYSVVENRYSGPLYHLNYSLTVTDADDDIDYVSMRCDQFKITRQLQSTNKLYSGSLSSYDFLNYNFDDIIGAAIQFYATTTSGRTFLVGTAEVKRVINQEIGTISPKNSDTISLPGTVLRWTRFLPGFTFKYKVKIFTDETPAILKWTRDNISADSISIAVDTTLPPYRYYWTISCVDEFKNEASSKPASIIVR